MQCDIREEDQVDALVDGVLERHGRIDLLVNNAGGQYMTPAEDITPKGFRTVIRLNVEGTWLMTHAVATKAMIPARRRQDRERHALAAPRAAGRWRTRPPRAPAVENLTRVLSIEWARFDIKLDRARRRPLRHRDAERSTRSPCARASRAPCRSSASGEPEEHAWLVAYLASPAGDYFSGAVLTIDGARDNWFGPWPPPGLADEAGKPLAEERRPKP